MYVASLLMQNAQYQDTMTWLEYIFNPTDQSTYPPPQRYWQMAPFFAMNANDWTNQQIQSILTTGMSDPATTAAINNWMNDPFDPHMIASLRPSAYAKATVMRFLDNLIAWGDSLFSQYTAETVNQAEQLYIMADLILGPAPEQVRLPSGYQAAAEATTYAQIASSLDQFSNTLVTIENVILSPTPPSGLVQGTTQNPTLPLLSIELFCIPPNPQLLAYWGTVADRLTKIRAGENIQGQVQPLPLYAPPLNPLLLAEAGAAGGSISGAAATAPIYRFRTYLDKAVALANDVRNFGSLILSALEKQDAETLAALRAGQEVNIQTKMLDVKTSQVTEAADAIAALGFQQAVVQVRYNFYSQVAFMNEWETAAMTMQGAALIANALAVILDTTSGGAHMVPNFSFGCSGFGGSPVLWASYGGENVASAASSWASVSRGVGGLLTEGGSMAGTLGGYQRRADDWSLQANIASAELTQIAGEIAAAKDRLATATSELAVQNEQISNAQAISDFLTNKYTNAQLYNWMITQLTTVHTQAYQLAFNLAQQAQNAYQYELGRPQDTFIQFAYWNSQYKGLTAGDSLLFDLRRMEAQYLAQNARELEITKHVSLAITQPLALVQLRETGSCPIALDESLFDGDHPGHFFRRLRSVALTIPCVTGIYTGVNATLLLSAAMVRVQPPVSGYVPQKATQPPDGLMVIGSPMASMSTIVTSSGQNDAGLFDVNLRDERWLPFECQGAISAWNLILNPRDNNFDFSTITDVVMHVRYTARPGGDPDAVRAGLKPQGLRSILVSVQNTFGDAYYSFFNPTDTTATQQTLTLPISNAILPYSNLGSPKISDIVIYFVLTAAPQAGTSIAATFGPAGGAGTAISLTQVPGTTSAGGPPAVLSGDAALASPSAPAPVALVVPAASVPAGLAVTTGGQTRLDPTKIEDILLVINYTVS